MSINYINIETASEEVQKIIKQDLKFKTGKFVWRIKFTAPLNPSTVNNVNLYVTNLNKEPLKTSIRYDSIKNVIEIEPLESYSENETYLLVVTRNVESKGGQRLKKEIQLKFNL